MVKSLRLLDPSFEAVPPHLQPRLTVKPSFQFIEKTVLVSATNNRIGSMLDADKTQRHLNALALKTSFKTVINCEPVDLARAHLLAAGLKMPAEVIGTASFDDFISLIASVDACLSATVGLCISLRP